VSSSEEGHLPELYQLPCQAKLGAKGVVSGRATFAPSYSGWRGTIVGPPVHRPKLILAEPEGSLAEGTAAG
jgi:hypothetical protein